MMKRTFLATFLLCIIAISIWNVDTLYAQNVNRSVKKDTTTKKKTVIQKKTVRDTVRKAKPITAIRPIQKKKTDSLKSSINNEVINGPAATTNSTTNTPASSIVKNNVKSKKPTKIYHFKKDTFFDRIKNAPYLPIHKKAIYVIDDKHFQESDDTLFYVVGGIFLLFGLVRTAFPKYVNGLFSTFFAPNSRHKKDLNPGQNNLPSFLTNILYCIGFGFLLALIIDKFGEKPIDLFEYWIYIALALAGIYLVKFITISLSGLIFNTKEDASTYANVVFQINKIIGFVSLPFILIIAFSQNPHFETNLLTIGAILLLALLLYRYIISFSMIAKNLQLNAFHFFIYLCTVEVIPILVLYKLFFNDLSNKIL